jgi:serine/threonine protein kinase
LALATGSRVGHYEVKSQLGEGGMGVVFRASDTKLQRDVSLKLLPDHFASDPERLARFQRDAQMLAALSHPNIALVYGLETGTTKTGCAYAGASFGSIRVDLGICYTFQSRHL